MPTSPLPSPAPHDVAVLDTHLHYVEQGAGTAVVFLHGNPTSSYLWRDVLPAVAQRAHGIAPDLVGMGASGKPDIAYRFQDHARYLDAFLDALHLDRVVLVGTDWGGALALDWGARHPGRARGVVVFETFLRPMHWSDWPPQGAALFRALRTPGAGEKLVIEDNGFLPQSLAFGVKRGLRPEERAIYEAPFAEPKARKPMLQWPREIPIDGEPADVAAVVERYGAWAATPASGPKLLLTFEAPSVLVSAATVDWARATFANLEIERLGPAGHHAPEDQPEAIGASIAAWLERHRLLDP